MCLVERRGYSWLSKKKVTFCVCVCGGGGDKFPFWFHQMTQTDEIDYSNWFLVVIVVVVAADHKNGLFHAP